MTNTPAPTLVQPLVWTWPGPLRAAEPADPPGARPAQRAAAVASMPQRLGLPMATLHSRDGVALRVVAWCSWRSPPDQPAAQRQALRQALQPLASCCLAQLVPRLSLAELLLPPAQLPSAAAPRQPSPLQTAWHQALQQAVGALLQAHGATLLNARVARLGLPPGQQNHHDLALCQALLLRRLGQPGQQA